jgi:hypothetical protein
MGRGAIVTQALAQGAAGVCALSMVLRSASPEPVDASRAAVAANNWFQLRFVDKGEAREVPTQQIASFEETDARALVVRGKTVAYAFDTPGDGCIAISADDEFPPIFHYSSDARLDVPSVPPAQAVMESFAERLPRDKVSRLQKTEVSDLLWSLLAGGVGAPPDAKALASFASGPVGPLLTTKWGQFHPYNEKCPEFAGTRCPVGCTATAMAQIMRYWTYPEAGTGSHSYSWPLGGSILSADFGSTTYDWGNMPDRATQSSPQVVKDAVSTLCYHCGVAIETQYNPTGSAASLDAEQLTEYFDYMQTSHLWKGNYADARWYAIMCEQIDSGWPVWYEIEGHVVVMDGYDPAGLLHLNMGWEGSGDGFWSVQVCRPRSAVVDIRASRPQMSLSTTSLANSCWEGRNAPDQSFEVWNSMGGSLEYRIVVDEPWLRCDPTCGTSGGEHHRIVVTYVTSDLPVGSYSANIWTEAVGEDITPQCVQVSLTVSEAPAPAVSVSPTAIALSCVEGNNALTQSFEVWNSGGGTLDYTIIPSALWLACSPISGTSAGESTLITVTFASSQLSPGTYSAKLTVSASRPNRSSQVVSVVLTVYPGPAPAISVNTTALYNTCESSTNARSQTFEVCNSGGKTLSYSISDDAAWLSCSPAGGASTGQHDVISLSYASAGLAPGIYPAIILVSDSAAANSPQAIRVCLTVLADSGPAIWHVDGSLAESQDGSTWTRAFRTIQEAVDAASEGDVVVVANGVYHENIHFNGRNIVLRSTDPSDGSAVGETIIDGVGRDTVVRFDGTEDETCVLSGFTIRNGNDKSGAGGGGIAGGSLNAPCTHATVENNRIANNSASWDGGGIAWCRGEIRNNTIVGNRAHWCGGGLSRCDGRIYNNLIAWNAVVEGHGGGLSGGDARIENNTIVSNTLVLPRAQVGGMSGCGGAISNCIIWGNAISVRDKGYGGQLSSCTTPTYSCIQDWKGGGEGNISVDPRFVGTQGAGVALLSYQGYDYRLASDSPCIDAGQNADWMSCAADLLGNNRIFRGTGSETVDMGAHEFGSRRFTMTAIACTANGKPTLTWEGRPDDAYTIWACFDLVTARWTFVEIIASQGRATSWTDDDASGRMKVYRIEAEYP